MSRDIDQVELAFTDAISAGLQDGSANSGDIKGIILVVC